MQKDRKKLTTIEVKRTTRKRLVGYKKDNNVLRASYDQIINEFLDNTEENAEINKMAKLLMRSPQFIQTLKDVGEKNEEMINKINKRK